MIWPFRAWYWNRKLEQSLKPDPQYLVRRAAGKKGWARRLADRAVALRVEPKVSTVPASIPSRKKRLHPATVKRRNRLHQIIARDGCNCWLCGKFVSASEASIDHAIPKSRGGSNHIHNLRLAHIRCNNERGSIQSAKQSSRAKHTIAAASRLKAA